jgi:hypothetical protein
MAWGILLLLLEVIDNEITNFHYTTPFTQTLEFLVFKVVKKMSKYSGVQKSQATQTVVHSKE